MNLSIFRKEYYDQSQEDDDDVYCFCDKKYRDPKSRRMLTEDFLSLFIEKNSDGTRNLRLKGNELQYRIGRRVDDDNMMLIASFTKKYPTLVKLDLSYNPIRCFGFRKLCKNIFNRPNNLEILLLVGCDIGCDGISSLANYASSFKLKELRLTGNKFGDKCGMDLYTILSNSETLEKFDIGGTHQTVISIPSITAALNGEKNTTLRSLNVSDIVPKSAVHQQQPDMIVSSFYLMLTENIALEELHLQKCGLDGHAVEVLVSGLLCNRTLLFLDIGYNRIGCFGAEKLAEYFKTSPALLGINLAGNSIGEIGGRALSFGLPYSKLRLLDLTKNKIKDQPLSEILLSIKKYQRMRLFYIFGNEIGPLSKEILERQFRADVYEQPNIDFQLFFTSEGLKVAKYPTNNYQQEVYNQLQPHEVRELRIIYNQLPGYYCAQHGKVNFDNYKIDTGPCIEDPLYEPPPYDEDKLRQLCLERERLEVESSDITYVSDEKLTEESSDSCLQILKPTMSLPSYVPEETLQSVFTRKLVSSAVLVSENVLDLNKEEPNESLYSKLPEIPGLKAASTTEDTKRESAEADIAIEAIAERIGISSPIAEHANEDTTSSLSKT